MAPSPRAVIKSIGLQLRKDNESVVAVVKFLASLGELASKDTSTASLFYFGILERLAVSAVAALEQVEQENPEVLKDFIATADHWPMRVPPRYRDQQIALKKLRDLGFGRKQPVDPHSRRQLASPITKAVVSVWETFMQDASLRYMRLPKSFGGKPLTKETLTQIRRWQKSQLADLPQRVTTENSPEFARISFDLVRIVFGPQFQASDLFRGFAPHLAPAERRKEIRKKWRQSWRSLAHKTGGG